MNKQQLRRQNRVRARIRQAGKPRLSLHRTNRHLWAQIIDDHQGVTLVASSTKALREKGTKTEQATVLGNDLAKKSAKLNLKAVVFDRGSYRYHGRVKALADAARKGGLNF